jgi:hypothetical protein
VVHIPPVVHGNVPSAGLYTKEEFTLVLIRENIKRGEGKLKTKCGNIVDNFYW